VLRFDYCGVGDSAGDIPDLSVAQWQRDVRAALEELEGLSGGAKRLSVVGMRLGAPLAATALAPGGEDPVAPLETLVLWDPVIDGTAYLDALEKLWRDMLADPERFTSTQIPTEAELMGFLTPPALRREIGALDLLRQPRWPVAKNVVIVDSSGAAAMSDLRARLGDLGQPVFFTPVPERAMWDAYTHVEVPIRAGHASAVLQSLAQSR
jgi:Fe2+ transport system protein FeoA